MTHCDESRRHPGYEKLCDQLMAELAKFEWRPIETAPKYPLDDFQQGPHFLARCKDGYIHEVWWAFPRKGSIAYDENYPPWIERIDSSGFRHENPKFWMPLPEQPKQSVDMPPFLQEQAE